MSLRQIEYKQLKKRIKNNDTLKNKIESINLRVDLKTTAITDIEFSGKSRKTFKGVHCNGKNISKWLAKQ